MQFDIENGLAYFEHDEPGVQERLALDVDPATPFMIIRELSDVVLRRKAAVDLEHYAGEDRWHFRGILYAIDDDVQKLCSRL